MARSTRGKDEMAKLRQENAVLKDENNKLKQRLSKQQAEKTRRKYRIIRKSLVVLLISAAVAVLTVANLLFFTGNTIVKQDRFVAATQPIIKDPVIQDTMALYATNSIFSNVNVQQTIESVLPPKADFLALQLTSQIKTYTQGTFNKVLANPGFQEKWNTALAKQHQRLISFASKYQGDGDISLNDVFTNLTASLSGTKLAFLADKQLPARVGDIKVISAPWLPAFHKLVTKIDTWRTLAVIILVACVAGAAWLSQNRRRALYIFSLASAVMMVVTLLALHVTRDRILSKVDPQYSLGVQHAIKIVFHPLVMQTVTIMLAGLLVGAVAWVSGPARNAVAIRRSIGSASGQLNVRMFGSGYGWTAWIQKHKRVLEWTAVGVITAIMLTVRLTITALFGYVALMIVVVLIIEILGAQGLKAGSSAAPRALR